MRLQGRTALVTGASRGIGAAVAKLLAEEGARVAICARKEGPLLQAAAECGATIAHPCDVSENRSVLDLVARVTKEWGRIDILVNNAGSAASAPVVKTSPEMWEEMLRSNLSSVFYCTRAVLPGMLERGYGRIVNIASAAGKRGAKYISAYSAAKFGVIGFTQCVAAEAGGKGVTCNAICPGYVDTPMTERAIANIVAMTGRTPEEARRFLASENLRGRFVLPDQVAALVLFLASEEGSAVNGEAINVW